MLSGTIDGVVTDALTGSAVAGARIELRSGSGAIELESDSAGHFRGAAPLGRVAVSIRYGEILPGSFEFRDVIAVDGSAAVEHDFAVKPWWCPGDAESAAPGEGDRVAEQDLVDHRNYPDVLSGAESYWREEQNSSTDALVDERRTPDGAIAPAGYTLTDEDALQREADRLGHALFYSAIDDLVVEGGCAAVSSSMHTIEPAHGRRVDSWFCHRRNDYAKRQGRWVLENEESGLCYRFPHSP